MAIESQPIDGAALESGEPRLLSRPPIVAGLLALAIAGALAIFSGASAALHRPLWLDEVVTQLVAHGPRGILHAMRSGVDFQPPPNYFLVWLADTLGGSHSPLSARLPSLIPAALTVVLLGATLRTRLSLASALAGALALAAHPLFMSQAVDARPYALWILATALTAESLRQGRNGRAWLAAGAAIALCTSHYFGVLSLAAVTIAVVGYARFGQQAAWPATLRSAAPLAAGGFALLALLPLARAQLAATSGRSWVNPATPGDVLFFLRFIWGWRPALLLVAGGAFMLVARRIPPLSARLPGRDRVSLDFVLVALLATAAVPVLVVLVSLTYKPVLVLRYSAPAVLAMAALCALAVETLPRPVRWLAVVLLVRAGLFSYRSLAGSAHDEMALFAAETRTVRELAARGIPTLSPLRHDPYRTSLPAVGAPAVAWMDLPDSLIERVSAAAPVSLSRNMLLAERDFGRAVQREFAFPVVISAEEARARASVALIRDAARAAEDSLWFPGRRACPLSARLVVFTTPEVTVPCSTLQASSPGQGERQQPR